METWGLETGVETRSYLYGLGMDSGYSCGRRLGCRGQGRGEVEGEVEVQGDSGSLMGDPSDRE